MSPTGRGSTGRFPMRRPNSEQCNVSSTVRATLLIWTSNLTWEMSAGWLDQSFTMVTFVEQKILAWNVSSVSPCPDAAWSAENILHFLFSNMINIMIHVTTLAWNGICHYSEVTFSSRLNSVSSEDIKTSVMPFKSSSWIVFWFNSEYSALKINCVKYRLRRRNQYMSNLLQAPHNCR